MGMIPASVHSWWLRQRLCWSILHGWAPFAEWRLPSPVWLGTLLRRMMSLIMEWQWQLYIFPDRARRHASHPQCALHLLARAANRIGTSSVHT